MAPERGGGIAQFCSSTSSLWNHVFGEALSFGKSIVLINGVIKLINAPPVALDVGAAPHRPPPPPNTNNHRPSPIPPRTSSYNQLSLKMGSDSIDMVSDVPAMPQDKPTPPTVDEKKLVRKIDLYLVPLVMGLYLFSFIDR